MSPEILEKLNSISDEFERAIKSKCDELGYDKDKGTISLEESIINLGSMKESLLSSLNSDKMAQFPISIQREIVESLSNIIKFGTEIIGGTDAVINLTVSIEFLNKLLWQYGFYRISTEEIELSKRLNKIKHLEVELVKRKEAVDLLLEKRLEIETIQKEIEASRSESNKLNQAIQVHVDASAAFQDQIEKSDSKATELLAEIVASHKKSDEELAESKASKKSIAAIQDDIEVFFEKVVGFQKTINDVSEKASSTVSKNDEATKTITTELQRLEGLIKDQIEKATGYSLFHSFQTRKTEIAESKKFWTWVLGGLVLLTIVISLIVGFTSENINMWFYIKLSATLPIIYAITFANVQYSRERRLEEEYAFKSNISISLTAYRELVEKAIDVKEPESRKKYSEFLIQSIERVFTPPTESAVADGNLFPEKSLDSLGKALENTMKPLLPLLKAMKKD